MNRIKCKLLVLAICLLTMHGQKAVAAEKLEAYTETRKFLDKEGKTNIELHFRIPVNSLTVNTIEDHEFDALLHVKIYQLANGDTLSQWDYELVGNPSGSTTKAYNLIDIKGLVLPETQSTIVLEIKNLYGDQFYTETIECAPDKLKNPGFSDIVLLDYFKLNTAGTPYSRGSILPVPRINAIYESKSSTALFYCEYYSAKSHSKLSYEWQLENISNGNIYGNVLTPLENTGNIYRFADTIFLDNIDLGDYVFTLKSFTNGVPVGEVSYDFSVVNIVRLDHFAQVFTLKELKLCLEYIYPIAGKNQFDSLDILQFSTDSVELQNYFFRFWKRRNPTNPLQGWRDYAKQIEYVNTTYPIGLMPGYKTDRGKTFLKYGPPLDIVEFHDNAATYPYEIWQYALSGSFGNAQFVFVNLTLSKNNFTLMHSTAIGEPQNQNWKKQILRVHQRDGSKPEKGWGTDWQNEYINE